jgi:cytochrome b561
LASASTSRFERQAVQRHHERYTRTAVVLHWIIAALVIGQFAWGWWMQEIPKQPPGARADAFNLHKSFGLLLLGLMLARLGWRIAHPAPPLPPMPSWEAMLAKTTHVVLYLALFVMPLSGYLGSVFSGYPVKWFGVTLPAWGWKDPAIKDWMSAVHLTASWVLLCATVLHVAGALRHALARDGVMSRMAFEPAGSSLSLRHLQ